MAAIAATTGYRIGRVGAGAGGECMGTVAVTCVTPCAPDWRWV
jgi:hypothetical protein